MTKQNHMSDLHLKYNSVITSSSHNPVLSPFMTYHKFATRVTLRVPHLEQELPTLPKHPSLSPVFSEVHVSLDL